MKTNDLNVMKPPQAEAPPTKRALTTDADYFERRELRQVCTYKTIVEDFLPQVSEIIPRLYISDFYSATSPVTIKRLGITHIVSVMKEAEYGFPSGIKRLLIPVDDEKTVDIEWYFGLSIKWIQRALDSSKEAKILVHCTWGKSRSACIVMAYLMATQSLTTAKAFFLVKKRRSFIKPNKSFMNQLQLFEEKLQKGETIQVAQIEETNGASNSLLPVICLSGDDCDGQENSSLKD